MIIILRRPTRDDKIDGSCPGNIAMYKFGPVQKKILLGIVGGISLGLSASPRQYFKTFAKLKKEWAKTNQYNFTRSIRGLAHEKLIQEQKLPDGSFRLVLTQKGKKVARQLSFLGSAINFKKPKKWDGKWRVVLFDIPEKDRLFRDILRQHLYNLDFKKLQHSVFVSPYPFEKEILDLVMLYSAEKYVRVITATRIDNEARLKGYFFKK
jgi:DNA-binding transcriptional regulator PaaX